jgi:hypothetical protein
MCELDRAEAFEHACGFELGGAIAAGEAQIARAHAAIRVVEVEPDHAGLALVVAGEERLGEQLDPRNGARWYRRLLDKRHRSTQPA